MRKLKFGILLALVALMTLALCVFASAEAVTGSDTGANGTQWSLDGGVLTVTPTSDNTSGIAYLNGTNFKTFIAANKANITSVVIENGNGVEFNTLTIIANAMTNVTKITIPNTITTLTGSGYGMADAPKLATFGPEGTPTGTCDLSQFTSVQSNASNRYVFRGTAFTKVKLPTASTVKQLPDQMFTKCNNLTEVTFPANITVMTPVFTECTNLQKVYIECNTVNMTYAGQGFSNATLYVADGSNAHKWALDTTHTNLAGEPYSVVTYVGGTDSGTNGVHWELAGGVLTVTPTDDNTSGIAYLNGANFKTFIASNKANITSVVIKNGNGVDFNTLTIIAVDMVNLTKFIIPSTITTLTGSGYGVAGASKLTTFGPEGTPEGTCDLTQFTSVQSNSYNYYVFRGTAFTSVKLPTAASVKQLPDHMFTQCNSLTEVTFPKNITVMTGIFTNCTALKKVTIESTTVNMTYATKGFSDATLYVYDGSTAHTWVSNTANVNMSGNPYEYVVMPAEGATGKTTGADSIAWSIVSGVVTVTPGDDNTSGTAYFPSSGDWTTFVSSFKSSIKTIVIKNSATREFTKVYAQNSALIGIPNLEKITIPTTVNCLDSSARYAFADNAKLATFGPEGTPVGTCDLTTITVMDDAWGKKFMFQGAAFTSVKLPTAESVTMLPAGGFNGCNSLTEVTIPDNINTLSACFTNCTNLEKVTITRVGSYDVQWVTADGTFSNATLYLYSGCPIYTWAEGANNLNGEPYTIVSLGVAELTSVDSGKDGIQWTYSDGVVTVTPSDDNTTGTLTFGNENWLTFKDVYKANITKIVIENTTTKATAINVKGVGFNGFGLVETIVVPKTVGAITANGQNAFAGNPALATFGPEGTKTGLCDISYLTVGGTEWGSWKMFNGAAFTSVALPTASTVTVLPSDMFTECDNLTEVVVPANITILTTLFTNCDNLEKAVILNAAYLDTQYASKAFSNATVYVYEGSDALTWVKTAVNMNEEAYDYVVMNLLQKGLTFDGVALRYKDYHGLRSVFTMNAAKVNKGYTLREYGTFFISADKVDVLGESKDLMWNGSEIVPVTSKNCLKTAVWKDGKYTANILSESGGLVSYAVTLVNFADANMTSELYIRGYEVWEDEFGNVTILYSDISDSGKTSFFDMTLLVMKRVATDNRLYRYKSDITIEPLVRATGDRVLASGKAGDVNYKVVKTGDKAVMVYSGSGSVDSVSIDDSIAAKINSVIVGGDIEEIANEVADKFVNATWVCVSDGTVGAPAPADRAGFVLNGVNLSGASIVNAAGIDKYYFNAFNNKITDVFGYTLSISDEETSKCIVFGVDADLDARTIVTTVSGEKIYVTASDADTLKAYVISLDTILPDEVTSTDDVTVDLPATQVLPESITDIIANGSATEMKIELTTNKSPVEYAVGETMEFNVELRADGALASVPYFKYSILREGDGGVAKTGYVGGADGTATIKASMDMPGFLTVKVWACSFEQAELIAVENVYAGAGAGIADIEVAAEEPDDFDEFWVSQIARLNNVPAEALEITLTKSDSSFDTYAVKVNCIGDESLTGYTFAALEVVIPKNKAPGSLGIFVQFMPAGAVRDVTGSATRSYEMISVFVNSHSVPQGMEASYYSNLYAGKLKNWWEPKTENADPAEVYYSYMLLRDFQALRWLKSYYGEGGQGGELWDGETLIVQGVSEGGFQALAMAALDQDVTKISVSYPAMGDKQGITIGRFKGHGSSDSSMFYYDTCYFARRITCEFTMLMGLIDTTCAPSANTAVYNNVINASSKQMTYYQFLPHTYPNTDDYIPYKYVGELPKY